MDYAKLTSVLKATALRTLGGTAGNDYSSWAEDIANDTIVTLLEKNITDETEAFALGMKIVRDKSLDHKRIESRRTEIRKQSGKDINRILTGQSAELLAASPLRIMDYESMQDRLNALSPVLLKTVRAYYIDGFSVEAIALEWQLTEDVIYKRLERARNIVAGDTND